MEFLLSMQGNSLTPMIIAEEVLTILTGIFVYTKSDLFVRKILQNWTRFESLITTCFKENNLAAVSSLFQLLKTVFSFFLFHHAQLISTSDSTLLLQSSLFLNFIYHFWQLTSSRFEVLAQASERQNEPVPTAVQTRQLAVASERLDMSLSNIYEVLVSIYIRLMKLKYVSGGGSVLIIRMRP